MPPFLYDPMSGLIIETVNEIGVRHQAVLSVFDPFGMRLVVDSSKERDCVAVRTFDECVRNRPFRFVHYPNAFPRPIVLERAMSLLGVPYHPVTANCQHVASWCATGEARSGQVEAVFKFAAVGVGVAVLAGIVAAA